ncbi:MAG: insulinase family protein [Defluviitaleaceae bacterium]|nr:insulinase family protein [Defluviitaleaceae bacterium]
MIETIKLKNGVRVVLENMPHLRSICFGIWVKNGTRHEPSELNGISHFIEHMLFKGTNKRSAKQIADEIDSIGGQINAYTTREHTCFYTKTLDSHFKKGLDILTDMFFDSLFEEEEIEKERNVIIEEINMYEDIPEDVVSDILFHEVYGNKSLGLPILGTKKTITEFNTKTFKDYFKERYTPSNIVLSVAGGFNREEVLELLNTFENFTIEKDTPPNIFSEYKKGEVKKFKDIEQVHIQTSFPSIPTMDNDIYSLSALSAYLGGGMSSRLFQKIREDKGLVYSVYSYNQSFEDTGIFSLYASNAPENTEKTLELMMKEIKRLKTDKILEDELSSVKEQLKANYILSLESSNSRMSNIGRSLLLTNKIRTPDEVIEKIDNISMESFYSVYDRVFDLNKVSIGLVGRV